MKAMTLTQEFDAELSADAREFIAAARVFGRTRIGPEAQAWETAREVPLATLKAACEAGFAAAQLDPAWGGRGLPFGAKLRMAEEFSRHDVGFAFALVQQLNVVQRIAEHLPDGPARELVPAMLAGERFGAVAMSEPGAGSDFPAITTRATRVDGGWRLDGEKGWISNAAFADLFITFAQTDPALGSAGIAAFLVRAERPGFVRRPAYPLHGVHAIGVGGFELAGHFVPDDHVVFEPGSGFKSALATVNRARIYVAAMCAGLLEASLAAALDYGARRTAFGSPLLDFQGLRWRLAGVATDLEAMRLLTYRASRLSEAGAPAQLEAAMAKKFANDRALDGVAACMQAMGANGLRADLPLARHLAAAKLLAYTDGTVEMMNERIGHLIRMHPPGAA